MKITIKQRRRSTNNDCIGYVIIGGSIAYAIIGNLNECLTNLTNQLNALLQRTETEIVFAF